MDTTNKGSFSCLAVLILKFFESRREKRSAQTSPARRCDDAINLAPRWSIYRKSCSVLLSSSFSGSR
jgi:hypothetical protein